MYWKVLFDTEMLPYIKNVIKNMIILPYFRIRQDSNIYKKKAKIYDFFHKVDNNKTIHFSTRHFN